MRDIAIKTLVSSWAASEVYKGQGRLRRARMKRKTIPTTAGCGLPMATSMGLISGRKQAMKNIALGRPSTLTSHASPEGQFKHS